ncbi:AAA family ATPase [Micromonospora sp. Llam7]|uniref:adenylate/guanylate cyclase domain-containing protein n=1 Tax=Micromonospora tarapacensis TaxID=2835305 RepID=UPI001C82E42C|nr:adenylate/guanylate cyclase domain-containing protein [Micromonospora tarapacensis]MBX7267461.1 AAA family ATPase [Micromonospora tarapacensis]
MPRSVVTVPGSAGRVGWPVAEERRTVTVLFVDIVGSTRLVDRLDPEDVRALQRAYFGAVAGVLRRWNGAVEKYVGDAVMALFGARSGDGWEAYRAVRAGLEIQRALDRRPLASAPGLRVRVGVATGEAVVDLAASHQGGHGMASGAVITLAARLQEYAPPGGVAVCPATHRAVSGLIAQRRAPAVTVTGKTLPVDVWHATGTLRPRPSDHDGPLLGRRRELATAREQLVEAVRGRGERRLLLLGPAGSGRTRLLRELARTTPTVDGAPVRWCLAACPPYPDGPLEPVADLVRGLTEAPVAATPDAVRGRLATALGALVPADRLVPALNTVEDLLGATGTAAAARAVVCWREVLLSLARRQPVVVAVDDLDRSAPALRRNLDILVEQAGAAGLPLVLVATGAQDTGDPARPTARVRLRPLDAVTTGRLLRSLLRRAGQPAGLAARLIPWPAATPGTRWPTCARSPGTLRRSCRSRRASGGSSTPGWTVSTVRGGRP